MARFTARPESPRPVRAGATPNSLITAAVQAASVVRFVKRAEGKERGMTVRRFVLVLGAIALVVGIIGLFVPVSVSNSNGSSLGCGSAAI